MTNALYYLYLLLISILYFLAASISGCAVHHVEVTAYLSRDLFFPPSEERIPIAVAVETEPDEPLLEAEVKRKIERLVAECGYDITPEDKAAYVLFAYFAMDSGTTRVDVMPHYSPGGIMTTHFYGHGGHRATEITHFPGHTTYYNDVYTVFTHYLGMTLYEHDRWAASDKENVAEATVWRSNSVTAGRSSDLRRIIDYLLIATFEHFGQDTGKQVHETLTAEDDRVEALR